MVVNFYAIYNLMPGPEAGQGAEFNKESGIVQITVYVFCSGYLCCVCFYYRCLCLLCPSEEGLATTVKRLTGGGTEGHD